VKSASADVSPKIFHPAVDNRRIYINYLRGGKCSSDDGEQIFLQQLTSYLANWAQLANWIIGKNFGN
jgi:hypothetical protein